MTGFALRRRRLIEQHSLATHRARELVAIRTNHVLVRALQWESRTRVVIELCRFPASYGVAARAIGHVAPRSKLPAMRIFVTAGAKFGRGAEIDVLQGRF